LTIACAAMQMDNAAFICIMRNVEPDLTRRRLLHRLGLAAAFSVVPGAFAEELAHKTPWVTKGPLYPDKLPLDTDNDLIIVNDSITPAVGEITHLSGRILDAKGAPIPDAVVEIWQVDNTGTYLKERGSRKDTAYDANFQGFGRFLTGSTGEYYFRTIKPVAYRGRSAPHIHFMIRMKGREPWTTQLYIKGHPGNRRDGVYSAIGDARAQEAVTVDFAPMRDSRIGELAARFDIVPGFTPSAND
jgi:protocatechuate 3,4-dioxygenase, beta subunit